MKAYSTYMERQTVSEGLHERLLAMENTEGAVHEKKRFGGHRVDFGALAACAVLFVGIAAGWFVAGPHMAPHSAGPGGIVPSQPSAPAESVAFERIHIQVMPSAPVESESVQNAADYHGFVAQGPGEEAKLAFPAILGVDFANVTKAPQLAASIALPEGSFSVDLEKEDILKLFWGKEGKPVVDNPKTDTGDLPLFLMGWQGYSISARATYDGSGELWELAVWGEKGEDSFALRAATGRIPPTCIVEEAAAETEVLGVPVSAWYRSYDRDGDEVIEHVCTSQFMAGDVGIRFENIGSGGMKAGEGEADDLGGAILFNAMLVNQLCRADGGLYLDEVAHSEDVPKWAEEKLTGLSQALEYEEFASYLPQEELPGYAQFAGNKDFGGRYSYQEGVKNQLFVRWSRNYDDVEVEVFLPEDPKGYPQNMEPVDVGVPESYDWRLYDGPICDEVPEEYQANFYKPTFRAGDMSLEMVKARGRGKDTGGMAYRFYVQHDNGVVVGYDCSGVSAEYVWSLVEATL